MSSDERAIENLIARDSVLVDDGDVNGVGVGELLELRALTTGNVPIETPDAGVAARLRRADTARQALPDFPLQPVATGTFADRFEKRGGRWPFVEPSAQTRCAGDTSRHRRPAAGCGRRGATRCTCS